MGQLGAQTDGCPWTGEDKTICSGECVLIGCELSEIEDGICFLWESNGEQLDEDGIHSNQMEVCPMQTTIYRIIVTDDNGGVIGEDYIQVIVNENVLVEINPFHLLLCEENELSYSPEYPQVVWSTGETTEEILVNETGTYSITATDSNGCVSIDDIQVYENDDDIALILEAEGFICLQVELDYLDIDGLRNSDVITPVCPEYSEIENYTINLQVIEDGISSCLVDFIYDDLQIAANDGYSVGTIIADGFCGPNSIDLNYFLSFGEDEEASLQIFALENTEGPDCLYIKQRLNYHQLEIADQYPIYNRMCEPETRPRVGCSYTVAEFEGGQWGYEFNGVDWDRGSLAEIILTPVGVNFPLGDVDNTCCDGELMPSIEEFPRLTRWLMGESTQYNWLEFRASLTGGF